MVLSVRLSIHSPIHRRITEIILFSVALHLLVVDELGDGWIWSTYSTATALLVRELYCVEFHLKCIKGKESSCQKIANSNEILDRLHSLKTSDNTAHGANYTGLLTCRNRILWRWILEYTSVTWTLIWNICHELTLESDDSCM